MRLILYIYFAITIMTFSIFWLSIQSGLTSYVSKLTSEQLEKYKNRKKNVASDMLNIIKMFCISAIPVFNIFLLISFLFRKDFFEFKVDIEE